MKTCLFCNSTGPFKRTEHIIPEALGNDEDILRGEVCDKCNQYFGSKVESFVLNKTPIAFWRTFLGIQKKKGALPQVDLSQPKKQKGRLPAIHNYHNDGIGFTFHKDYSVSINIDNDQIVREILDGTRNQFRFVITPLVLSMMGRFLCKIGLEFICLADPNRSRLGDFNQARRFARFGEFDGLWPIFYLKSKDINDLKLRYNSPDGPLEEIICYEYSLFEFENKYIIFALTVGIETWVISLNDPFPTPKIRLAFPGKKIKLIWYSPDELRSRNA